MERLIPGLPNELALECLSRVLYQKLLVLREVCKGWKAVTESPAFLSQRRSTGHSQEFVILVQARYKSDVKDYRDPSIMLTETYCLITVFDPLSVKWVDLPPPPSFSGSSLPWFCSLAAAGTELVVVGGKDPNSWEVTSSVYVYSFLSSKWRCGANMPGGPRHFFGCASDGDHLVFVVGGFDIYNSALSSAMAYDVHKDRWYPMPNMKRKRKYSKGAFIGGKFLAIGGGMRGDSKYDQSVEAFDPETWSWDPVQENVLEADMGQRTCVIGQGDHTLYACREGSGDIAALKGSTWTPVAKLPSDVARPNHLMRWRHKLLVFGLGKVPKETYSMYMLDLHTNTWTNVKSPERSVVHDGCVLEL